MKDLSAYGIRAIAEPDEVRRLTRLAWRFASPCNTKDELTLEICCLDLDWNLDPLEFAIRHVLGSDSPLYRALERTAKNRNLLLGLWHEVGELPYSTVERMVSVAQNQRWGWEWLLEK